LPLSLNLGIKCALELFPAAALEPYRKRFDSLSTTGTSAS
jgi:hypothetical protein